MAKEEMNDITREVIADLENYSPLNIKIYDRKSQNSYYYGILNVLTSIRGPFSDEINLEQVEKEVRRLFEESVAEED